MPVTDITSESQWNAMLRDTSNKLIVADFFATWCPPCKAIAPHFAALSDKFVHVAFVKIDVDKFAPIAQAAGVKAMPSFGFYGHGKLIELVKGARPDVLSQKVAEMAKLHGADKASRSFMSGSGHALNGPSSSSSSSSSSAQEPAEKKKRFNPWAQESFSSKILTNAEKKLAEKPLEPEPASSSSSGVSISSSNAMDVADVNEVFLGQLVSMGFDSDKAANALRTTGGKSLEDALVKLTAEVDGDAAPVAAAAPTPAMEVDELDVDEDTKAMIANIKRDKASEEKRLARLAAMQVNQEGDVTAAEKKKLADMTSEEKMEWLSMRRQMAKKKEEERALEKIKSGQKSRVELHKAARILREQQDRVQAETAVRLRAKEKRDKAAHKKELRRKMELAKQERKKARELEAARMAAAKAKAAQQ
jgi:thioredoxin 1